MWLVLCDPADQPALWAYQGLRERGLEPLELLSPQTLLGSTRTAHRVDRLGARFELTLPDGRVLDSREVDGVLNRVAAPPFGILPFSTHTDAVYAAQELSALLLSLLTCLAPVSVNRPCGYGLCGAWRSTAEWTALAAAAGLPVPPARISSDPDAQPPTAPPGRGDVLVLGEHVFGVPAAEDEEPYVRLARLAEADLLGIDLHREGTGDDGKDDDVTGDDGEGDGPPAVFAGASPLPDLRPGGDPFLDRLLKHLTALSPGAP
ncbi:hypothetical protein AB0F71_21540 [Kitasatospora sp. NPDC028055]|uniref:hypothetical protein n=1 Tax=Kitasatospora sp. NPDC028055 TaxID=3155653 RepID=UPI0033C4322B